MPYNLSSSAEARARVEFQRALDSAVPAYEVGQLELVTEEIEDFIRKEVERKLYVPLLPSAGDQERKWIERLETLASNREWSGSKQAFALAQAFRALLPREQLRRGADGKYEQNPGRYYARKALSPRTDAKQFEWLIDLKEIAHANKEWDRKWFAQMCLDGRPEAVSDFKIECLHLLKLPDGSIERRVRLVNVLGEKSGEVSLSAKQFAAPEKFREWCLAMGNFSWSGNQLELQNLHEDINRQAAWKVINLVVTLGWMPLAEKSLPGVVELDGVWFAARNAMRDGQWLKPDNGVYWISRKREDGTLEPAEGYEVAEQGRENPFFQKKPDYYPDVKLSSLKPVFNAKNDCFEIDPKDELQLTSRFFREVYCRWRETTGTSAYLIIGSMMGFFAGPEIYQAKGVFPGLWLHGQQNSGKSTQLEFAMEIVGFSLQSGIMLRGTNSTGIGLQQAADQYSNLPVWLDEFRADEVDKDKLSVIHNGLNRAGAAKFNLTKIQRTMRTTFCISGESTTGESALRGRYPHIQIAKTMRQGTEEEQKENFHWFCDHRKMFFVLGRMVLENRKEFVKGVFKHLEIWDREQIDSRLKIVHGVGYASFLAFVDLFHSRKIAVISPEELREFKDWMLKHSRTASEDVISETNINVFWDHLIAAVKDGAIDRSCFFLRQSYAPHPPGSDGKNDKGYFNQAGWEHYELLIEPHSTMMSLQMWLAKGRSSLVLKKKDLRDQMSKEEYWLQGQLKARFTKGKSGGTAAWGIDVDKHPLGTIPCSDEEHSAYLLKPGEGDPRKGPLFEIVDWLKDGQKEEE